MRDSRQDSWDRLSHISEAIQQIDSFTNNINEDEFLANKLFSSAVLFQFSVIGEAIVHVDKTILDKYAYPWYKVRAFRNLISHEYFNIKLEAVWDIIKSDLEQLKKVIDEILNQEFHQ